jgi:alkanesulfonate monooxygenase SsuD/methylene tetrahydromethanopterin reductase-like flavin-dependent oxidoreductase (luciferase family)
MFPNPPGLLRVEPHSEGLRDRIWWGSSSNATARWAAQLGMSLQSSTLKHDLRHSFAVHTLVDWYRNGEDVQARLPALATYLEQVEPRST